MAKQTLVNRFEDLIFNNRRKIIAVFAAITVVMIYSAITGFRIDTSFTKSIPVEHEYMQTYLQYRDQFGGANRVLVALVARDGNIYTPEFMRTLKAATDEVFFISGVDRTRVTSLFTPNVRFTEVTAEGIAAGNVVPADFRPTPEGIEQIRKNVLKAGIVGRLVANDFSGAIISAELMEVDPVTGKPLDYIAVAAELETKIRDVFESESVEVNIDSQFSGVDVHMIGFVKAIGDISNGAQMVVVFFGVAFVITALFVGFYTHSWRLTLIPVLCALVAVIWQLGILFMLGFGIDPLGILVPFLVFAIGVSHGVQMISAIRAEVFKGKNGKEAARSAFERLLVPGGLALASDTIGFITILLIKIQAIQEMAITASIGVGIIVLTNLILVPVLLSFIRYDEEYRLRLIHASKKFEPIWQRLTWATDRDHAKYIIAVALVLLGFGLWKGTGVKIGDLHPGVPELRENSRYNIDSRLITERFSIGVDVISVIVEAPKDGCIDYEVMKAIDDFTWYMSNVPGVQSAISLPVVSKVVHAGWNEGSLKWRVIPRNTSVLVQVTTYVPTSSGLLNADCSVMPVHMFTSDHKATTIEKIVAEVKAYRQEHGTDKVKFRLATGGVGVMAATNEDVQAAQFPILVGVFSVVILLCWIAFGKFKGMLCIVLPLALVSILAYALMTMLEIGLKVSTLPVVALGVGVGVDYGIYIYARFRHLLKQGELSVEEAYLKTLRISGNGVLVTGITLAVGVGTWIFSPLKFQADMGILLTFMFLVNMIGAIILLPALASMLLIRKDHGPRP